MPRRAAVHALPPDEDDPPMETAATVAVGILVEIAEDNLLRASQRQRARQYLRDLERASQRDEDENDT
jgi:hypothetical protein